MRTWCTSYQLLTNRNLETHWLCRISIRVNPWSQAAIQARVRKILYKSAPKAKPVAKLQEPLVLIKQTRLLSKQAMVRTNKALQETRVMHSAVVVKEVKACSCECVREDKATAIDLWVSIKTLWNIWRLKSRRPVKLLPIFSNHLEDKEGWTIENLKRPCFKMSQVKQWKRILIWIARIWSQVTIDLIVKSKLSSQEWMAMMMKNQSSWRNQDKRSD